MIKKIKQTIKDFSMLDKGDKVLVCVSGGPDSVCLLLVLNSLKKKMGLELIACHLNHKLRGAESDKDERYTRRLAKRLGIQIFTESIDVSVIAKQKRLTLEQAARDARYEFFARCAKRANANKIAIGHTRDDQAETLFLRLLRGAGLRGLKAMPPVRRYYKFLIIRPLIEVSREQILFFLKKRKIKPRLDASNIEIIYARNKIRLKLIPYLEKEFSPNIKEILARTADTLSADYDYLQKKQNRMFKEFLTLGKNGAVALKSSKFRNLHRSAQRGLVREAIQLAKGNLDRIDYRHWSQIQDLIINKKTGTKIQLPDGLFVIKGKRAILFTKNHRAKKSASFISLAILKVPGGTKITRNLNIQSAILEKRPKRFSKSSDIEYFDMDKIKFPLIVRSRKAKDGIRLLGMRGHKLIQDIFIDEKIRVNRRLRTPILQDSSGNIMWICGLRMSEDFKITPSTNRCLKLRLVRQR